MANNLFEAAWEAVQQHPQASAGALAGLALLILAHFRKRRGSLSLPGPPSTSLIFGVTGDLFNAMNASRIYGAWSKVYGPVYHIPFPFGESGVVLMDPKAIASFFSKDTTTYQQTTGARAFLRRNFGDNIMVNEGEDHKRQRRALSSGFSIAAIRKLTPIFLQSAHHVKDNWDEKIKSNGGSSATIEVSQWVNAITLDSIGNGGFSHDFGATQGKRPLLQDRFQAFGSLETTFVDMAIFVLSGIFPAIGKAPTKRRRLTDELCESIRVVAADLLEKARAEKQDGSLDKSILGSLVQSETASKNIRMGLDEMKAQISLFMLAGYETTGTAISWSMVELARHPEVQKKLREELSGFTDEDPSYEQLSSGLPYLDAVVCETLRTHPSAPELTRQAGVDDVLPLTNSITDANGKTLTSLPIPAGTKVRIPLGAMNLDEGLWGEDSHTFNPDRWIDDGTPKKMAQEVSGFRHLLTFSDGPRMCLGRLFALTEFKAVLSVLVRNYAFELPDGPDTKVVLHRALTPRPKIAGEQFPRLPLIVHKVTA